MEKQDVLEHDCFYHIFNRGNNKENLFIEDENYFHFLKLIKNHLATIVDIYSYCLMKNHFHLVLKIKSKKEIESILPINKIHQPFSNLFNAYTKAINKKYNREGSLFKVRFKRERIETENYLMNVIIINPPSKAIIEEMFSEINSLNNAIKNYKIHPLPLLYYDNKLDEVSIDWLGVYNDEDKNKLNEFQDLEKFRGVRINRIMRLIQLVDELINPKEKSEGKRKKSSVSKMLKIIKSSNRIMDDDFRVSNIYEVGRDNQQERTGIQIDQVRKLINIEPIKSSQIDRDRAL